MNKTNPLFGMKNISLISAISALVVLSDQAAKFLIRHALVQGESLFKFGIFSFTLQFNTGAGFSFLQGQNFLLLILNVLIVLFLLRYIRDAPAHEHIGLAFVLGGAVGNLIDRALFGMVTDFISVWKWPVFNIADCAVCIGVFPFFATQTKNEKKKPL